MLELQLEEPAVSTCDCCGGQTTRLTRFVSRDGDAFAVYFAAFSDNHEPRVVRTIVSIGSWGGWEPGHMPEDRVAIAMDIYCGADNYQVTVVNAAESLWADADSIGRKLDRDQALQHPWIKDAFHISDHMVTEDLPLKAYLDGTGGAA